MIVTASADLDMAIGALFNTTLCRSGQMASCPTRIIIDKKIINIMKQMNERNKFIRGIRSWIGFKQTGLRFERDKRYSGEVKYTFRKLIRLAFDGLLSFSYVPLQIASLMGFIISLISFFGIFIICCFVESSIVKFT